MKILGDVFWIDQANVGLGNTHPLEKLHVTGNILATGTLTASNLVIQGGTTVLHTTTSNTDQLVIENAGTGPALKVFQSGPQPVAEFYDVESGLALIIADTGSVGINSASPQNRLDVGGNAYINGALSVNGTISTNNSNIHIGTGTVTASSFFGTATQVSQSLSAGSYLTGSPYNGSAPITFTADATTGPEPNKLVARDASASIYASNLGIGTSIANYPVDIYGDLNFTGILRQSGSPYIGSQWTTSNLYGDIQSIYYLSNVGIGTTTPSQTLDVYGNAKINGYILDGNDQTIWIPGSAVRWTQTTPSLNTPNGITFTPTTQSGSFRYVGTEIIYSFNLLGTVTGTPTTPTDDYTLNLTYPISSNDYPTETVVGSLVLTNTTPTTSNIYPAYAKTLTNDAYKLTFRYLNGTYDSTLANIRPTSTLSIQGQVIYTTATVANSLQLPTAFTAPIFTYDTNSNIIFNGQGFPPTGTFEVRSTNPNPGFVINQTQPYDILQLKRDGVTKAVFDQYGNLGIGTVTAQQSLHIQGNALINGYIMNGNNETLWIPGSSLVWYSSAPSLTTPPGVTFNPTSQSGSYRYAGGEVMYVFNLKGSLSGTAGDLTKDFSLLLPFPTNSNQYPTEFITGPLVLQVSVPNSSNYYQGYAKTIPTDQTRMALRYINGTCDSSFTSLADTSVLTIQGQITYSTPDPSGAFQMPYSYTSAIFTQDANSNVIFNGAGQTPASSFEVRSTNPRPAVIINQMDSAYDILQLKREGATQTIVDSYGNVGIGTANAHQALHVHGNLALSGFLMNEYNETTWVPGSTLTWYTMTPSFNIPTGISLNYLERNGSYRYTGTEVVYQFALTAEVTGSASNLADDYTINLTYPTNSNNYPTPQMLGSMMVSIYQGASSNLFTGYTKTLPSDQYKVAMRYLNGTYDRSLTDVETGYTMKIQGQFAYNTYLVASSYRIPYSTVPASFNQDGNSNVIFNGAGQTPSGNFEVRGGNNNPAFVINQTSPYDILQAKYNNAPVMVLDKNGNLGIGTASAQQPLHIQGNMMLTGYMMDEYNQTLWIPGSALTWIPATPILTFPTGISFTYTTQTGSYRHAGTELVYNFTISGDVSGTASTPSDNYLFNLSYPANTTSNYPIDTVVGSMVMTAYTPTGSNVYSGYARTINNDNTRLALRYLNGTYDRSLTDIPSTSTLSLQGQITYTTQIPYQNLQLPRSVTTATFTQDANSNVIFNGGGQAPTGTFEIRSTNSLPALVINQNTANDLSQWKRSDITKTVLDQNGNLGIGTTVALFPLHVIGSNSPLTFAPGTTSTAPLTLSVGQNRSPAMPGSVEYDGITFYGTPIGTQRGIIPTPQYYCLNANYALTATTAAQSAFGRTVVLSSSTRYQFEANMLLSKNNASANTLQMAWSGGTIARCTYWATSVIGTAYLTTTTGQASGTSTMVSGFTTTPATLFSISAATGAAVGTILVRINGILDVTTGGTITPQIALITNTPTSPLMLAGSYITIQPISVTGANTSVGSWA